MERQLPADSATLRGARAVGIVCATLFILPVILSIAFPSAFLFQPYNRIYERMIAAVLLAFGLGLLLALRDPVRNAGVFAVGELGEDLARDDLSTGKYVEPAPQREAPRLALRGPVAAGDELRQLILL